MKRIMFSLFLGMFVSEAFAHVRLVQPIPRVLNDNIQDPNNPCGTMMRGSSPLIVAPGSFLRIRWIETVDHPGYYRLRFSASGDANWTVLADRVLDVGGEIPMGGRPYELNIQVPSNPCSRCTLQLIQVMTDRNPASEHYSCADLVISGEVQAELEAEIEETSESIKPSSFQAFGSCAGSQSGSVVSSKSEFLGAVFWLFAPMFGFGMARRKRQ